MNLPYRPLVLGVLILRSQCFSAGHVLAGGTITIRTGDRSGGAREEECGSCCWRSRPSMLPASSWKRMMANLGKTTFGDDASVDQRRPLQGSPTI